MNQITYVGKHPLTREVFHHVHTDWELILCTSGECDLLFNEKKLHYGANDVAIIPPMLYHAHFSDSGFTNLHISMENTQFSNTEPEIRACDSNGFLKNLFEAAYHYYSGENGRQAVLLPRYGQLIADTLFVLEVESRYSDSTQQIKENILLNFSDCQYNLKQYLDSLPFNTDYLIKRFKQEVGQTPLQYLTDQRLSNAADNLRATSNRNNISELAWKCGFRDPLYFSRLFKKKYGIPPRSYAAQGL